MLGHKRFRGNPVFDSEQYPMPKNLKHSMDLVGTSFYNAASRNLEIMNTSEKTLYGLMTHYESQNFCWLQPTRFRSKSAPKEYDDYIKRANKDKNKVEQLLLEDIKVGADCLARYDVDQRYYRAIIISDEGNDQWLVFFIDYGNSQICNTLQIMKPYHEPKYDHFHAPMQAVCCRLYNIVPRLPANREEIDIRLEKFFSEHYDDFLEIRVMNHRPDFVVDCDVFLVRRGDSSANRLYRRHIGQELVDAGLATFADPKAAFAIKETIMNSPEFISIEEEEEDVKVKKDDHADCSLIDDDEKPMTPSRYINKSRLFRYMEIKNDDDIKIKPEVKTEQKPGTLYQFRDDDSKLNVQNSIWDSTSSNQAKFTITPITNVKLENPVQVGLGDVGFKQSFIPTGFKRKFEEPI